MTFNRTSLELKPACSTSVGNALATLLIEPVWN